MSTLQKHLFRELKLADTAVKNKESLRWNPLSRRYVSGVPAKTGDADDTIVDEIEDVMPDVVVEEESTSDRADLPVPPTKNNPLNVAVYGLVCTAAKSYQSAICE